MKFVTATVLAAFAAVLTIGAGAQTNAAADRARTAVVTAALQQQQTRFAATPAATSADSANAYQFTFNGLMVPHVPMAAFRGEVVMVVNTASRCGFTPQYAG